ncbi:unnamed protein product [Rotaria sp. Silwood2]|nr:unnamed protein product [Rotaria sp. Silwood2]
MTTAVEIVEVPTYVSDDEMDKSETVDNGNKKRVKKRQRNWVEEIVFNNTKEAEEAVMKENQCSYHYTNTTAAGKKKFFRCNKAKARVLIVGTTDLDRHFHLFSMAICSNEATQDFRFIFRALQDGLHKLNFEETNPDFLITDSADAIRNAFQDVFGEKPVVMC